MTPASKNRVTLLKTGLNPTMVSSRPAQSLAPNQFPLLQNVRSRFGVLEAKRSEGAWSFTGLPGGALTIHGAWSGTWYGVEYALLAVKNGYFVDIYDSADGMAWTIRGQSAAAAGIYPSSCLTDSFCATNGVCFQPINDPFLTQGVLISDGQTNLMWTPALATLRVRPVTAFPAAGNFAKDCTITGDIGGYLYNGSNVGLISGATTGSTFTYTEPSAVQIAIGGTQALNNTLTLNFTNSVNVATGKQFAMLLSTTDTNCDIFRNCKIELYVGATPFTIHDPSGSDYNECSLENFSDPNVGSTNVPKTIQLYVWAIQDDNISGAVTKVVFTYKGSTDRYSATTLELLAAGISGSGVSGVPNYAVSYVDTHTGAESATVVLNSEKAKGSMVTYLTTTGTKYFAFPLSYGLRMNWSVKVSPTVAPSSFNGLFLYRKDPGSTEFLYAASAAISDWTGNSGVPPNTWISLAPYAVTDTTDETGLDPERPAPTAYNTVPPAFTCAAWANNRLFIGKKGEFQFSEYRFPMRFSLAVRLDDRPHTAGGYKFASENPQAFSPLLGDLNLDRIGMFTDKGTYAISGFDAFSLMRPSRISQFGTNSPKSVVGRRETTFLLDDARHLRNIPGQSSLEGRSQDVKDILDGIPVASIGKAWGAVYNDRYHLFYTKSGDTTNKVSFVVDLLSGTLVQDSYSTGVVCSFMFGGKLILVKSDGTATQLEAGTSDVTVSVTSRELVTDGDSWLMDRQRIYADANVGKSFAMSWTGYPQGNSVSSSVPLDPVLGSVRIDVVSPLGKGISGRSIQAGFSGAIPGGKRIYEWEFETEARVSRGTA